MSKPPWTPILLTPPAKPSIHIHSSLHMLRKPPSLTIHSHSQVPFYMLREHTIWTIHPFIVTYIDWETIYFHSCGHYSQDVISKLGIVLLLPLHMLRKQQVATNDLYLYEITTQKATIVAGQKATYSCWTKGNYISCTKDYLKCCLGYPTVQIDLSWSYLSSY